MSINKWKKRIIAIIESEGCRVNEIVQTKKHFKIYTVLPLGEERMFVTCITPSDSFKGQLNFRGDIRRAVRYERENS